MHSLETGKNLGCTHFPIGFSFQFYARFIGFSLADFDLIKLNHIFSPFKGILFTHKAQRIRFLKVSRVINCTKSVLRKNLRRGECG